MRKFLLFIILVGCLLVLQGCKKNYKPIAEVEYPIAFQFASKEEKSRRGEPIDATFVNQVAEFSFESSALILNTSTENQIYSPISLYMALAMLADVTNNNTRNEIVKVLKVNDLNTLREQSSILFRKLYFDNEKGKMKLANSIWLNKNLNYDLYSIQALASYYYASSFNVDFASDSTSKKISAWIADNTGNRLGNKESQYQYGPDIATILFNTVYFQDQWVTKFESTKTLPFNLKDHSVNLTFMNKSQQNHFVDGSIYKATDLSFKNGNKMIFILPDEGFDVQDIMGSKETISEAINQIINADKTKEVNLYLPKFNFGSTIDLNDVVKTLGIKEVFEMGKADFSTLLPNEDAVVSSISQEAMIAIDEYGCVAAAYTKIVAPTSSEPEVPVEVKLDRPFIVVITGVDSAPLFIGIVNDPSK